MSAKWVEWKQMVNRSVCKLWTLYMTSRPTSKRPPSRSVSVWRTVAGGLGSSKGQSRGQHRRNLDLDSFTPSDQFCSLLQLTNLIVGTNLTYIFIPILLGTTMIAYFLQKKMLKSVTKEIKNNKTQEQQRRLTYDCISYINKQVNQIIVGKWGKITRK